MGDKAERKNLDAVDGFAQIVRVMARGFAPTMRLAGYLVRLGSWRDAFRLYPHFVPAGPRDVKSRKHHPCVR